MNNYWKKYNENLTTLVEKINKHNIENKFNFIEKNPYNHIRDLQSLILIFLILGRKSIKVLDYGSNPVCWTNMRNKFDTSNLDISIYDPFFSKEKYPFDLNLKINTYKSLDELKNFVFDITFFASVSQYIKNFFSEIEKNEFVLSEYVYFSHTPFSLESTFETYQNTDFKGLQTVRSYEQILKFMEKHNYQLIFQSDLGGDLASVEKINEIKTIYANLLFKRN